MPQRSAPVDRLSRQGGRPRTPGARAMRTRNELLDCTQALVRERPFREVTPALVTQRAGLTPPAFYRYFGGLTDAIVELSERMVASVHGIADLVREGDWGHERAEASAAAVVDRVATFWVEHRALYRVCDLLAEEGDERFTHLKATTFADLSNAFSDVIARHNATRPGRGDIDPEAQAGVIVAALIHVTAREPGFDHAGIAPQLLRSHLARLLASAI